MIFRITRWQPGVPGGKNVLVLPERPEPRHNRVFQGTPSYDAASLIARASTMGGFENWSEAAHD